MSNKYILIDRISNTKNSVTAIIGLSKNSGKTTVLNWLIQNIKTKKIGVFTTGRDGENFDTITGDYNSILSHSHLGEVFGKKQLQPLTKPKIALPEGVLFTARKDMIIQNSSALSIIEKLPYKAGGNTLWIVKSELPLLTEIVGPPSVKEQTDTVKKLFEYGAEKIFIDGSIDRKAIIAAEEIQNIIMVASPEVGNLQYIVNKIRELENLALVPEIENDISEQRIRVKDIKKELEVNNVVVILEDTEPPHKQWTDHLHMKTLLGNENTLLSEIRKKADKTKRIKYIFTPASITERSFNLIKTELTRQNIIIIIKHPFKILLDNISIKKFFLQLRTIRSMNINAIAVNSFAANGNHIDCDILRQTMRTEFDLPVVDIMEP